MAGLTAALRVVLAPRYPAPGSVGSEPAAAAPAATTVSDETAGGPAAVVIEPLDDGRAIVDGTAEPATLVERAPPRATLNTADGRHDVLLLPLPQPGRSACGIARLEVVVDGWRFEVDLEPETRAALRQRATRARGGIARGGPLEVRAIIPGRVVSVDVVDGDAVEPGQRLLVVEAMKMQNEIRSPRAGTVHGVVVGVGRTVELGDLLLVVE